MNTRMKLLRLVEDGHGNDTYRALGELLGIKVSSAFNQVQRAIDLGELHWVHCPRCSARHLEVTVHGLEVYAVQVGEVAANG